MIGPYLHKIVASITIPLFLGALQSLIFPKNRCKRCPLLNPSEDRDFFFAAIHPYEWKQNVQFTVASV